MPALLLASRKLRLWRLRIPSIALLICLAIGVIIRVGAKTPPFPRGNLDLKFQNWLDEGEELRARRLYDEAVSKFNQILELDPLHEAATYEIAQTYLEARRWAEAMDWFDVVSFLNPQRRDAFAKRWQAIMRLADGDSLLHKAAVQAVRREIADFLKSFPWDWETLAAARDGALQAQDSILSAELEKRILKNFPNTPAGYNIIADHFYDGLYPIWNDNEARIKYIHNFLRQYPVSDFRETAWRYLTYSLSETGDAPALRSALAQWMAEDPDNPLPYERAVGYLLELGVSPDSLLPVARRAVELCSGWRGKPLKTAQQRIMEGKVLYAGTRLNIARVLQALGRGGEARLWLQDGMKHCGYGVDDPGTTAAFEFYLGVIAFGDEQWEEALAHFVEALIQGDTRGKWTALADSAAQKLFQEHFRALSTDLLSLARSRCEYAGPVFDDVTDSLGLSSIGASRVAWGDANGDGYDDLLLDGQRLFLNDKGAGFVEVTAQCGLGNGEKRGGVWADVDLDGDLDLFCAGKQSGAAGDRLYLNQGNDANGMPCFQDVSEELSQFGDDFPSEGAAWGDLQGDGRPDLYVANYESANADGRQGNPDYLYLNLPASDSSLGFRLQKMGPQSGLQPPFGENLCGRGVSWGDFDNDGDQDIYVSNYRLQQNFLWVNNGDGTLTEKACFYGVGGQEKEGWWGHTIGSACGDFDNDGDLDLITANLAHPRYIEFSDRTCLYENQIASAGIFRDVRRKWGIKYEETHSDPAWADVDADGDLDLYITSIYKGRRSFLYLNDLSEQRFRDVTYLAGVRVTNAWGCAFSDFDNDGDLDLVVASQEGLHLFRNRGLKRHWLEVDLEVPGGGLGTKIVLKCKKERQWRIIQAGKGTTSQDSHVAYFGLGDNAGPVSVSIYYPSGKKSRLRRVAVDRKIVVKGPGE